MKISKWLERARIGIYLGKSPRHARSVALVLNPQTGNVSPQYHVKFDDTFETVRGIVDDNHATWKVKCGFTKVTAQSNKTKLKYTQPIPAPSKLPTINQRMDVDEILQPHINDDVPPGNNGEDLQPYEGDAGDNAAPSAAPSTEPSTIPARTSSIAWKPSIKYLESIQQEDLELQAIPISMEALHYVGDIEIEDPNPLLMIAKADKDTMYWDQAMKQPDSAKFIEAAKDEINTHEENEHWEVIPIEEVPENSPILDSVWSMKRNRRLKTNEVYKHKACLNIHGGQQEHGVNYWETYSPVVTWAAIRLLIVLAIMCSWYTLQIDFILAYPQAPVECELYMRIPRGFTIRGGNRRTHVLKILRTYMVKNRPVVSGINIYIANLLNLDGSKVKQMIVFTIKATSYSVYTLTMAYYYPRHSRIYVNVSMNYTGISN
jgi:Reverse transcriptase (RNA-dependent DNA polymerase)